MTCNGHHLPSTLPAGSFCRHCGYVEPVTTPASVPRRKRNLIPAAQVWGDMAMELLAENIKLRGELTTMIDTVEWLHGIVERSFDWEGDSDEIRRDVTRARQALAATDPRVEGGGDDASTPALSEGVRDALQPFADIADHLDQHKLDKDRETVTLTTSARYFRDARAALQAMLAAGVPAAVDPDDCDHEFECADADAWPHCKLCDAPADADYYSGESNV